MKISSDQENKHSAKFERHRLKPISSKLKQLASSSFCSYILNVRRTNPTTGKSANQNKNNLRGSSDGAVARELGYHQCDPAEFDFAGPGTICGFLLLLALIFLPPFLPFTKINISKFQFDQGRGPA